MTTARAFVLRLAVAFLAAPVVGGCCESDAPEHATITAPTDPAPAAAPIPVPAPAPAPGAVRGRAVWRGQRLRDATIVMSGGGCDTANGDPVPNPRFAVAADGGLPYVFVWVHDGPPRPPPPPEKQPVVVEFKKCMLEPHAVGVTAGRTVRFLNTDAYCGALKVAARNNPRREVPKLAVGAFVDIVFPREELPVHVGCDVHSWIGAVVYVVDHAQFAMSSPNGEFQIEGLPPGDYEFHALREGLTAERRMIDATFRATVEAGGSTSVGDIELK